MPESAASAAKLAKFYGEMSPSVDTVKAALTAAGVDAEHPQAQDLYRRDLDCHNLGMFRMLETIADVASRFGAPAGGDVVLDLGCGVGGPGRYLADRYGCSVVGADLVPIRIEIAQALTALTAMQDRITYRIADATALEDADDSFTQVWMLDVSMHVRDKRALFGEIARVLEPGGLMVMHDQLGPLPAAMRPVMRQAPYIAPSLPQLVRYVEGAGLRMVTWHDTTAIAVEYFRAMRDLVLQASAPDDSRRGTGIPILDGYLETLADLDGRTGCLVARRLH
jgi:ubiquinone/menaquinone biosynthesis C-methylase UbiE